MSMAIWWFRRGFTASSLRTARLPGVETRRSPWLIDLAALLHPLIRYRPCTHPGKSPAGRLQKSKPMRRGGHLLAIVALLGVLAVACRPVTPSPGPITPPPTPVPQPPTRPVNAPEMPQIGVLTRDDGGAQCTASVVDSASGQIILTARHCLGGLGSPSSLRFAPGYQGIKAFRSRDYGTGTNSAPFNEAPPSYPPFDLEGGRPLDHPTNGPLGVWSISSTPIQSNAANDLAFLVVDKQSGVALQSKTGALHFSSQDPSSTQGWTIFAYDVNWAAEDVTSSNHVTKSPYDSQGAGHVHECQASTSPAGTNLGGGVVMSPCGLGDFASGAPWVSGGSIGAIESDVVGDLGNGPDKTVGAHANVSLNPSSPGGQAACVLLQQADLQAGSTPRPCLPPCAVSTSGAVVQVSPPPSLLPGNFVSSTQIRAFPEQQDVGLTSPLAVDLNPSSPTTIPAGTSVSSLLLHANWSGPTVSLDGSVTFGVPILGVIYADGELDRSDFLGVPGTTYPTGVGSRGIEPGQGDSVSLSPDSKTLSVHLGFDMPGDEIRIITSACGN